VRVFVAGASGAIGEPLVRQLLAAGHAVTGMTRRAEAAEAIRKAGAEAAICDVFDRERLVAAIEKAAPEAVVNELTSLPRRYIPRRKSFYEATNRVRAEGGGNLIAAAHAAGARRFLTQSIAFLYAPEGEMAKDEEGRPFDEAPEPFGSGVKTMIAHERAVTEAEGMEGLVLRYGQFYGPGTYFAPDGFIGAQVRKRRVPVVGEGSGLFSFLHTEDAAGATVAALDHGSPGVYNVVDDEPAPLREWLPVYAEALGAKPPRRVPVWLAKLVAGSGAVLMATGLRGASNQKAKRELRWTPRYPSWRQGFREAAG
jgi:nucleoside-diphosphate-sugar epimerase